MAMGGCAGISLYAWQWEAVLVYYYMRGNGRLCWYIICIAMGGCAGVSLYAWQWEAVLVYHYYCNLHSLSFAC